LCESSLHSTNTHYVMTVRWYVSCSDKYPKWSSIVRILSVELWLVLIISIVITAVSITLFGRYSYPSERQSYKTLTGSLTKVCAVILGLSVLTCHAQYHQFPYSSPGCVSLSLLTLRSKHFSRGFLLTPVPKHQSKIWIKC
jgi:hypothetical protein